MTAPTTETLLAALATVNDPEIRKPITELAVSYTHLTLPTSDLV